MVVIYLSDTAGSFGSMYTDSYTANAYTSPWNGFNGASYCVWMVPGTEE